MKPEKSNHPLSRSDCWLRRSHDYDNPYDERQEYFLDRREIVIDPALVRAIGFYNIYHQSWALIEHEKMLMHWGNTTFGCDNEFKECMKLEGVVWEDIFDYLFDVGVGKFLLEKERNIFLNYLRNRSQSISNLMKILMII